MEKKVHIAILKMHMLQALEIPNLAINPKENYLCCKPDSDRDLATLSMLVSGGIGRKKCGIIIPWITTLQLKESNYIYQHKQMPKT